MVSRQAVVVGVIGALSSSLQVLAQSSACDSVAVTGGVSSGTYSATGLLQDGKDVFAQAVGDSEVAVLGFYEGTATRRERRLDDGHTALDEVLEAARQDGEQSLVLCATGFWVNLLAPSVENAISTSNLTFPIYVSTDCADHPTDITTDWFVLECETCEPEPAAANGLSIECDVTETGDDANGEPSPSPAAADDDNDGLCSEITVTGGGVPGTYPFFDVIGDKAFYGGPTAGIGWLDISNLRRRALEAGSGDGARGDVHDLESVVLSTISEGGVFHTLEGCSTEIWYMTTEPNANPITYPVYVTPDCADHVLDVTTAWFVIASEGGTPGNASPQPVLTCTNEGGAEAGSSGPTPSPGSSPTDGTETGTSSSASGLLAVGSGSVGIAVVGGLAAHLAAAFLS